jgi:hypothetical protein
MNSATGVESFVSAECEMWHLAVKAILQKFFTHIFFHFYLKFKENISMPSSVKNVVDSLITECKISIIS